MLLSLLGLIPSAVDAPKDFYNYLAKKDPSYSATFIPSASEIKIDMTSQTWQGIPWKHTVLYREPKSAAKNGVALLYITGDGPRPADLTDLALIVGATNMPVATLFNVPNQPIWDMKEDDLIAHTFQKYLATGDSSWPLLFPMAKSALRAMDAVQEATKNSDNPIKKFVVTGASKRGWTTWFVGASKDPRVLGIAPLVIDNLNVSKQMPHQLATWGKYSEQIEEYTRRGLQAQLQTPKGKVLARMIDPYYYLSEIKKPVMIVNGGNDSYWTVDALSIYWNDLKMPHWVSIVPNAGHDLGNKFQAIGAVGAFAHSLAGEFAMPKLTFTLADLPAGKKMGSYDLEARSENQPFESVAVLVAAADDLDFRPVKWEKVAEMKLDPAPSQKANSAQLNFKVPPDKNVAVLCEARYRVAGRSFTLSKPVVVLKLKK